MVVYAVKYDFYNHNFYYFHKILKFDKKIT